LGYLIAQRYRDTVFRMRHSLSLEVTKAVVAAAVVGFALFALPARAQAQAAPPGGGALGQGFGDKGQLALSSEAFIGFDKVNHAGWGLAVKPALDYFILPSISAGLVVSYSKRSGDISGFGVGARAGLNLNVLENLGIWPKVGVIYEHDTAGPASFSTTWISAFVPVMFHPIAHFFIALAPYYNLKVAGDGEHSYGFSTLFGGWL
jgi:hypothetical protein